MTDKCLLRTRWAILLSNLVAMPAMGSLTIDLRVVDINGSPVVDAKHVQANENVQEVTVNVYAAVQLQNPHSNNANFYSIQGSFQSTKVGPLSAVVGRFIPAGDDILDPDGNPTGQKSFGLSPFADNGTTNGKEQDLSPFDGNLDFGGEPMDATGIGNFFAIHGMKKPGITICLPDICTPNTYLIGRFEYDVQAINPGGITELNYVPRRRLDGSLAQSTALWQEGISTGDKDGFSGELIVGAPITITAVPEPVPAGILGCLIMLGLRRRR